MAPPVSSAEQIRRRREAFILALKLGCTPREAEDEIRKRIAREQEQAAMRRMAARSASQPKAIRGEDQDERPQLWWTKD